MTANIIDGKAIATAMRAEIAQNVRNMVEKGITPPGLAVILVGDDPASQIYVRNKKNDCIKVGFYTEEHLLPAVTSEEELKKLIIRLNQNPKIHGILLQLPLPAGLNEKAMLELIAPEKDVDCFHPLNVGNLFLGIPRFLPCTPAGVMEMLKYEKVNLQGKRAVVVGRSNIVGKPMALLLMNEHATVTICHSRTIDLPKITREADIVVVAIGKAKFLTEDMVSKGQIIIDVGQNRVGEKLVGDVDFDRVAQIVALITPVPGGVGPMTRAMLLKNTMQAERLARKG
ncbi:MAG: bifunctional methylenetetrahydrofolate dehydrogenase/methenyltetrahydrofolate cyclohydrolase FolD [bacterium]|nr:bifunctional methylenetetrahydrofolate dehydrogenase/methenyltetrahydrofolate cyclohydrolase FolD [bacterium]MDD5353684.1 bifunctional methylenetetrahydrofolate dehydrogenase/methenyltetrahydrofolate cyclohydrolase FolD [bacterium]